MRRLSSVLAGVLMVGLAGTALAAKDPVFESRGAAIRGYDPVSYFNEGMPQKGDKRFTHEWQGTTWRFVSAAHRDRFAADPEAFAPQYGGYCAWAVSQGYTASTDPDAWAIVDGKLYLNYDKGVQKKWDKDRPGFIAKANANWPKVLE